MNDLEKLNQIAQYAIDNACTLEALEQVRVAQLGKKGVISEKLQSLGQLPPEERKEFGAAINKIKIAVTEAIDAKKLVLEAAELNNRLSTEKIDVTLPVRQSKTGKIHPISQVIDECIAIFAAQGFKVEEGPEIEDDFHNFTALNIPLNHPAREMQDTFYLQKTGDVQPPVLRTHTSPVQIRTMENGKPPFKFIAPGRVYRSDYDMTHTPMFHQIEGLYIDKGINMGHLKGCLHNFLKAFFELDEVPLRFRPSFFPFTEPSAEVDIGCDRKDGELKIGEGSDWLEILGCGMVHPNVLKNVGIDPEEYQGFAFGLGIERLAMLKYGAPDLRNFFDSDIRWLNHYGFGAFDIPSQVGGL
ncbi:MAG: phenylalanyl-tRNA synthetase alpha chain [Rickettsiaceae bacterium]|jgi:phenylalanyl-tRNA synthetase alpha chain|nr:phenylalanyl-tRNA synthetase alpha chain [Rickettsiaceae bacterium]